jgi:phosphoribosylformimino-5-aminoimidazole carboxamide ribonucleotide (ProFAR) isomerase
MVGLPLEPVRELRAATRLQLIAAGGITTHAEIEQLHQMGVEAVVGMALYSGRMTMPDTIPVPK